MHVVHGLVELLVRLAGIDFVGANGVGDFVQHVAAVQRVEDAQEEVQVHLQAGFGVGLAQAAGLLEQQHAEAVETGVAQRQAILGFVHAEAAWSAGARREEHVAVDDFLLGQPLLFQALQILHQVADGEVSRVALAVVAIFLAGLKRAHVGRGHGFGDVTETFERAMHQLFVLPGEAAEQQGGPAALFLGERMLDRAFELMRLALHHAGFAFQARALFSQALLDDVFDAGIDLDQSGGWCGLRFKRLSAHSTPLSSGRF